MDSEGNRFTHKRILTRFAPNYLRKSENCLILAQVAQSECDPTTDPQRRRVQSVNLNIFIPIPLYNNALLFQR
jgi:hypothetical protein